jgi:hypothetical protein
MLVGSQRLGYHRRAEVRSVLETIEADDLVESGVGPAVDEGREVVNRTGILGPEHLAQIGAMLPLRDNEITTFGQPCRAGQINGTGDKDIDVKLIDEVGGHVFSPARRKDFWGFGLPRSLGSDWAIYSARVGSEMLNYDPQ